MRSEREAACVPANPVPVQLWVRRADDRAAVPSLESLFIKLTGRELRESMRYLLVETTSGRV
jgi:hypothetical protein